MSKKPAKQLKLFNRNSKETPKAEDKAKEDALRDISKYLKEESIASYE